MHSRLCDYNNHLFDDEEKGGVDKVRASATKQVGLLQHLPVGNTLDQDCTRKRRSYLRTFRFDIGNHKVPQMGRCWCWESSSRKSHRPAE